MTNKKAILVIMLIGILVSCQGTAGDGHDQGQSHAITYEDNAGITSSLQISTKMAMRQ